MNIRFHCHYGALTGYGRYARDTLQALYLQPDIKLSIAPFGVPRSPEPRYSVLDALVDRPFLNGVDIEIFHSTPRALANSDWPSTAKGLPVAMTTWETSDFPVSYEYGLDRYAAVVVPSAFCAQVINHLNVHQVPIPLDMEFWTEKQDRRREGRFRFYSIGAWNERKNMDGVLRAYFSEFSIEDNVELKIISNDVDIRVVKNWVLRSGVPQKYLPRLRIPEEPLTEDEILELHHSHDCFVSATRSEGWGLGGIEAAAVGNPVIMPGYGGQLDWLQFVASDNRYAVHWEPVPAFIGSLGRGVPGQSCKQTWAEPSILDLGRMMRVVASTRMRPFVSNGELRYQLDHRTVGPNVVKVLTEIIRKGN